MKIYLKYLINVKLNFWPRSYNITFNLTLINSSKNAEKSFFAPINIPGICSDPIFEFFIDPPS